jgi:adenylate cyclase
MGYGVTALAALGDLPRMREWIERAVLVDPTNYNMRYNSACALVTQLGDVDRAIDLLDVYFANARSGDLHHARLDPDLDTLRDDPRLVGLIAAAERRLAADVASSRPDRP